MNRYVVALGYYVRAGESPGTSEPEGIPGDLEAEAAATVTASP